MKYFTLWNLIALAAFFAAGCSSQEQTETARVPRALYTYSFGGLEDMAVPDAVALLEGLGYAGVAAEGRGEESLQRLEQYLDLSEQKGDDFVIPAAFMAHRFSQFGFDDSAQRAAIDRLAGKKGATLWTWVRDDKPDGTVTDEKVEAFIAGIVEYAQSKGVRVILYPHYNTYYETVEDALPLVKKINHPDFQVAINLCHELMSYKGDRLAESFAMAKGRIGAIILSGALIELDNSSVGTMNESTILSLDDSVYDLRPYLRLIKESEFDGPIGFINFRLDRLTPPEDYLARTMARWNALCEEVALHE
ncbi:sugar phosphate isomerase/epimerase [Opitutaceae bacterium]|nr:sugar phosphate isomerase/epimerase [Opitutaceae bacterium]